MHVITMELIEMIIIALQITATFTKKKHKHDSEQAQLKGNSDESIENLLYYKDCKHKNKETPTPVMLRATPPPPTPSACPCPRMCCSMCCDCNAPQPFIGRQMAPLQTAMEPIQVAPQPPRRPPQMMVQPQLMRASKRKRQKNIQLKPGPMVQPTPDPMLQPPIGSRRDLGGFTRENIKNLISHDQDIKKILKDLVRVTMTKVDLVEAVNARRNMEMNKHTTNAPMTGDLDEDYYND